MNIKVWYACYGSNLKMERFMKYINNCADTSVPEESKKCTIPYELYFAGRSNIWNNKGVAFVDENKEGRTLGRVYKINMNQFEDVQRQEGAKYSKKLFLGYDNGIPVYTFTCQNRVTEEKAPDASYIETIIEGLKETYPEYTDIVLKMYLYGRGILQDDDKIVLDYVINSEHGVTLEEIAEDPNRPGITRVRKSISKLAYIKLIRQDSRSVAKGSRITDKDAVVYTVKENRELINLLLLRIR